MLKDADDGVAVAAVVGEHEALRRGKRCRRTFLDDAERAGNEPAAGACRSQRAFAEALAVRRVGEKQAERLHRADLAERGRVAAKNLAAAGQAEALDVRADQAAPLGRFFDEQRKGGTARQGLQPERTGSGEEIEHARALEFFRKAMR